MNQHQIELFQSHETAPLQKYILRPYQQEAVDIAVKFF